MNEEIPTPTLIASVALSGVLVFVGIRKGGWWHILTIAAGVGGLSAGVQLGRRLAR